MPNIVIKVIDASALAAAIFGETSAEHIAVRVRGCDLVAPHLLEFELVNVCIIKMRRVPADRELFLAAYRKRGTIKVETLDVDYAEVLALAQRTGLTGYDASYLLLAQILGVELVTLDRQLLAASEKFK
jgi:predicted nucleic acid-binding protein